jgi:hypothetical protein
MNPQTGELVGTYDVGGGYNGNNELLPESVIDRTFLVGTSPFFNSLGITSYNLSHFTPLAVIDLSQFNGNLTPGFIRWGESGLAFVVQSGCCGSQSSQVVLVHSPMMLPLSGSSNPQPVTSSLSPVQAVHGGGNFKLTINGSGFVPGSRATWNGSTRTVDYVSPTQLTLYVPGSDVASPRRAAWSSQTLHRAEVSRVP